MSESAASTYVRCVCVREAEGKSGGINQSEPKPQEGAMCATTHNAVALVVLLCCCFVALHIASRSGGIAPESTSNLLARSCGWLA